MVPMVYLIIGVFRTLSSIYDGIFCENSWWLLVVTISVKRSILGVSQGSEYAYDYWHETRSPIRLSKVFSASFFLEKVKYNNLPSLNISSNKFAIVYAVLYLNITYLLVITTWSNVTSSDESYLVFCFFSRSQRAINLILRDYFS